MFQSQLFSKTGKNLPEGEGAKNAQLLIKGGFINKSSAGVYSFLPLGLRVLNKINAIIREEMNALGAEELLMPSLIHRKYWEQSGRWDADVIYRVSAGAPVAVAQQQFEYGLGWTHEEVISSIAKHFINSYKDLPKAVYQIQTKFRAEARAQAGLLRGREFLMKDLYSFHADQTDLDSYYKKVILAYRKILGRLCLKARLTEASGGAFTKEYTHEFQVLNPAGEDTVLYCEKCDWAQNKEIAKVEPGDKCPECGAVVKADKGIEMANIFKLGTKYSEAFNLNYSDKNGKKNLVVMGSYGIGPTRIMGTLAEEYYDDKGILWPDSAAPFKVHLLMLGDSDKVKKEADKLYKALVGLAGESEVLYDERNASAGEKLNDADLIGVPVRVVVSEKTLAAKKMEVKRRDQKSAELVDLAGLKKLLK